MINTVGVAAEKILLTGIMSSASEAKKINLVDQIVKDESLLLPAAEEVLKKWLASPDSGRVLTKQFFRKKLSDEWLQTVPTQSKNGWNVVKDPKTVKSLEQVLKRLSSKSKL